MPKRCANIHKRKDNRWEGRIKIGRYPNGATKYHSIYGKTYTEVKEKMDELRLAEKTVQKSISASPSFSDVVSLWFPAIRIEIKQSTAYRYEYLLERHILPILGGYRMSDITSAVINKFLEDKLQSGKLDGKGGLSAAYVKAMSNVIKMVIEYAVSEDLCLPLKSKISRPIVEKDDIPILSHEEQAQLKAYIDNNMDLTCLGIIISLYAGLRIGEVCALSWNDIDLNLGIIHIRHTVARIKLIDVSGKKGSMLILDKPKTKSSQRDIPISSILMPYLREAQRIATSDFVVSDKIQFLSPRTFEYRYHRVIQKSVIDDINYHALRHTFATRCVEADVDIKSLSEMLGHSNVSITLNTYVHSSMELKRRQLEKLSA